MVYRRLPSETVVFNLQTGKYHGLNATAGSMLEALDAAPAACATPRPPWPASTSQPQATVERDMRELCDGLLARGLIELDGNTAEH